METRPAQREFHGDFTLVSPPYGWGQGIVGRKHPTLDSAIDLTRRSFRTELMEEPGLAPEVHVRALRALGRLNAASGIDRAFFTRIAALAVRVGTNKPLRVLDLACGGGDVTIALARRAKRAGLALEVAGCDVSSTAVDHARKLALERGARVRFFQLDCIANELPTGYDAVTSSLFVHHLDHEQALGLLGSMTRAAGRLVLVSDLVRSRMGHLLARVATRVVTRSHVVHVDGPRSVERAFTLAEARELTREAGLASAVVRPDWPCRWLLEWARE